MLQIVSKMHINELELLALKLALVTFVRKERNIGPYSIGKHICTDLFHKKGRHKKLENDLFFQIGLRGVVEQQNDSYSNVFLMRSICTQI